MASAPALPRVSSSDTVRARLRASQEHRRRALGAYVPSPCPGGTARVAGADDRLRCPAEGSERARGKLEQRTRYSQVVLVEDAEMFSALRRRVPITRSARTFALRSPAGEGPVEPPSSRLERQ